MRKYLSILLLLSSVLLPLCGHTQPKPRIQSEHEKQNVLLLHSVFYASSESIQKILAAGADIDYADEEGATALMWAARSGNAETVKTLLTLRANIKARDRSGRTALFYAFLGDAQDNKARAQQVAAVLLDAGADINAVSRYGETPLSMALTLQSASAHILQLFLEEAKADHSSIGSERVKALQEDKAALVTLLKQRGAHVGLAEAALSGEEETVHKLLRKGADIHRVAVTSALENAIRTGRFDVVKLLLSVGANPNAQDRDGTSLLMQAVGEGRFAIVQALVEAGADVNTMNHAGENALMIVHGKEREYILKLLLDSGGEIGARGRYGKTLLMTFAEGAFRQSVARGGNTFRPPHKPTRGLDSTSTNTSEWNHDYYPTDREEADVATVWTLVERGADVNARNAGGGTALMIAAINGQKLIVKALLACGADVNSRDKWGETALTLAPLEGIAQEVVPILLQAGAQVSLANALTFDDLPRGRAILKEGGDTRTRDCFMRTPLMLAAIKGQVGMVQTLLERGSDANAADSCGRTPLMAVIQSQTLQVDADNTLLSSDDIIGVKAKIVALLLAHHADPNRHTTFLRGLPQRLKINRKEETALSMAQNLDNRPVIDLLIRYGAKPQPVKHAHTEARR